ncbi:dihydropteroate synthase [Flavobacterium psychrophilum]|uniref:dihydropteroate synthase n=1 Tax=Flavobacterium psychrophilum TaxID=96345 RepID=UPI0004F78B38|nr:dihydropteroate synthase [Flavobacterium psychrophilum]AIN73723.1 dihydropteroate synthase [Flavobacterium psychrophilum FPG3]EKT2069748.1 dihydropteroate synthase [Flavobacterium psychrophilum]EKT2072008.1 dihydropteroate synthase [Flavobacterium psychrophilum]EKT4491530.1 dihydropteroate synthase [Flavobacterium psychrophilum]MBF2045707.1 dihydropteroate synthase [Flavobacterium psychrophilum]
MTINCKGQLIDLSTPKVMGILNVTPDSFYDGGRFVSEKNVLIQVENMLQDGANFIDIGGQSSKPKAAIVSIDEELKRVVSIVDLILKKFPETMISIDTFNSKVAQIAVENGAAIINDISAGNLDDNMFETIAKLQVPYIMMHMRGTPQTMQEMTNYDDLLKDILFYFSEKVAKARSFGINDLIIDPGFGFAKTLEQNFELLNKLELFEMLELPILVGVSRKSMIYKTLETTPENALNGTSVLNTISLTKGGNILRVHDVKEAVECVKLYNQLHKFAQIN